MRPTLLLTGPTGFLGRALASALHARGQAFRALVREGSDVNRLQSLVPGVELARGDLNDPESLLDALQGIDVVVHTAALVSFRAEDRDRMMLVNGEGTANLVNMALEAGVKHLVHVSSVAALNRQSGKLTTLRDHWPEQRPHTTYAESKFDAEREVLRGQAEGLAVSIVYPSTILGIGDFDGHNTSGLWRTVAGGLRFYPVGHAGFVALDDVVTALLHCLDHPTDGTRMLLNGSNLSWREFFERVAASIGVSAPGTALTGWQSTLLWPLENLRAKLAGDHPRVTREGALTAQQNYRYDGSSYTEVTGQTYTPVPALIAQIGKAYLNT